MHTSLNEVVKLCSVTEARVSPPKKLLLISITIKVTIKVYKIFSRQAHRVKAHWSRKVDNN